MNDGPVRRSDRSRAAILAAARERFAADGYERATIRAIAADARIDPAMVMRYYGSKEKLFAAAAEFDLQLPDLSGVETSAIGEALVRHFAERWDGDETLTALLRAGVTHASAAERMREIFATQLIPLITRLDTDGPLDGDARLDGDRWLDSDGRLAQTRAGLVASQMLGLALCRYVLAFPPVVALSTSELVAWLAPTVQRYLTAPQP